MTGHSERRHSSRLAGIGGVFVLALLLTAAVPALGNVYGYVYGSSTATVRSPSVVLQAGNIGSSSVSYSTAATATATAGLTYYETADMPTSCSTPTVDTNTTAPGGTGSFTISSGQTACLWTPAYSSSSSIPAGTSVLDLWASSSAASTPTLDGSAAVTSGYGIDTSVTAAANPASSIGASLTTNYGDEVLVLYVTWSGTQTISGVAGAGLAWSSRGSATSGSINIAEYYAKAASAISAQTITVSFLTATTGDITLVIVGVTGVNFGSPFDPNFATAASSTGNSKTPSVTVSTTNAIDLVISGLGFSAGSGTSSTHGASFTDIAVVTSTGSTKTGTDAQYLYATTTRTNLAVDETLSKAQPWGIIADALQMSVGVSLTTSSANDVVVASVAGTGTFTATTTDGDGLSWTNRKSVSNTAQVTEWYAISTGALAADRIGVTFAAVGGVYTVTAFGVKGANTASPFDGAAVSASGSTTTPSTSFSTTLSNDFLLGLVGIASSTTTISAGSGYTAIQNAAPGGSEYQVIPSAGANTVSFTLGAAAAWGIIADAIAASSSGGSTTLSVSAYTTNSGGTAQYTLLSSGTTNTITSTKSEVKTSFATGAGTVPSGGYVEVTVTASASVTIYWGSSQLTNFETPAAYDYVLAVNNPTSASWNVNLAVATSSGISRLSNMTIWLKTPDISPYTVNSQQIALLGGSFTKSTGSVVTLAASTTMYVYLYVTATSTGTSTVTLSLKVQPSTAAPYAYYTIDLTLA